jgi:hypothetical protein
MTYYEWLHESSSLFGSALRGEPLIPNMHVCPEPFDPEVAAYLLEFFVSSGIPTTQRVKARIRLGLRNARDTIKGEGDDTE